MFTHIKDILSFDGGAGAGNNEGDDELHRTIDLNRSPTTESQMASGCCASPFSNYSGNCLRDEVLHGSTEDEDLSVEVAQVPSPRDSSTRAVAPAATATAMSAASQRGSMLAHADSKRSSTGDVEKGTKDASTQAAAVGAAAVTAAAVTTPTAAVPVPITPEEAPMSYKHTSEEEAPMEMSRSSSLKLVDLDKSTDETDTHSESVGVVDGEKSVSTQTDRRCCGSWSKMTWLLCIVALLIIIAAIVVPVVLLVPQNQAAGAGEPTEAPTAAPTIAATLAQVCEPSYDTLDTCVLANFSEEEATACIDCVWRFLPQNVGPCDDLTRDVCTVIQTCDCDACETELMQYLDCQSDCDIQCGEEGVAP